MMPRRILWPTAAADQAADEELDLKLNKNGLKAEVDAAVGVEFVARESRAEISVASGHVSASRLRDIFVKATGVCLRHGCDSLLILNSAPINITIGEAFQLVNEIPSLGLKHAVAILDRNPDNKELLDFMALVARNRLIDLQVFECQRKAEIWLDTRVMERVPQPDRPSWL